MVFCVPDRGSVSDGGETDDFPFGRSSTLRLALANVKPLSFVIFGVSCGRTDMIKAAPSSRD